MGDEKAGSCGKRSIQVKEIKANKRKMENGWLAQSTSRLSFMKRKDQLSRIHIRTGSCFFSHSILISFLKDVGAHSPPPPLINYSVLRAALWTKAHKTGALVFLRTYSGCLREVMSILARSQDDKLQPQNSESSARQLHRQMQKPVNYFC